MVKTISFNVRCCGDGVEAPSFRAPGLSRYVLRYDADTIGFQEATPEWMELLKQNIGEKYDYVGVAREDGENKGEYGPVFYKKEKFDLIDSGTIWLSSTPNKPSKYLSSACTRICTWASLKDKVTGESFTHINTHLDHVSEAARLKQLKVLLNMIGELEKYGPVICTGDFNVEEGAPVYAEMTKHMKDAKHEAADTDKGGTFTGYDDTDIENKLPIDFIFIKNGFKALVYKIMNEKYPDGNFYSDHFGLYAELDR